MGYGLGQIYGWTADRRKSFLLRLGMGLSVAFVVLRAINIYGDPIRWSIQKSAVFTRAVISEHQQVSAFAIVSF